VVTRQCEDIRHHAGATEKVQEETDLALRSRDGSGSNRASQELIQLCAIGVEDVTAMIVFFFPLRFFFRAGLWHYTLALFFGHSSFIESTGILRISHLLIGIFLDFTQPTQICSLCWPPRPSTFAKPGQMRIGDPEETKPSGGCEELVGEIVGINSCASLFLFASQSEV